MSITFDLHTPQDMLAKARREQTALREALQTQTRTRIADALFNFAVTAYHVKDWLKESASGSYSPADVETYLHADQQLRLCREICNASKHQRLSSAPSDAKSVSISATGTLTIATRDIDGVNLDFEKSPIFRVKIVTFDGARFEVNDFASYVIQAWELFFVQHGLIL